jgi:small acid-soluble spore protein H (minor)
MDKKRAEEISTSPVMENVTHLGTQVYIDKVNDDGTATVHQLGEHDKKRQVPLTELFEHKSDNR